MAQRMTHIKNFEVKKYYLMTIAGGDGEPAKEDALARLMAIAGKNHILIIKQNF